MARRIGSETSATRAIILDTTEKLMVNEGYAAVSTRRVAAEAGLKPPLIHYYFPTTDDLFLAVYRRVADQVFERLEEALSCRRPLRALWNFICEPSRTSLTLELMALANHRAVVREELIRYTERTRHRQVEAIETLLREKGIDELAAIPPIVLSLLMVGLARALVMEGGVGISLGHDQAHSWVEHWLEQVEPSIAPESN